MNNNSDPLFERYADMDFTNAKPVSQVPALAKLQAEHGNKSRITMRLKISLIDKERSIVRMQISH